MFLSPELQLFVPGLGMNVPFILLDVWNLWFSFILIWLGRAFYGPLVILNFIEVYSENVAHEILLFEQVKVFFVAAMTKFVFYWFNI